jgi:CO/xanthine dehydrogenase FAD-binding subunit
MKQFEYLSIKAKEEALECLQKEKTRICLVAGCSNVLPYIRDKIISAKLLMDISDIETLIHIEKNENEISIGALTTISDLINSQLIKENCQILYQAAEDFADPLVRNTATIGGNLADASPAADMAPPLLALNAVLVVESLSKKREILLKDFFIGPRKTVLNSDEMITSIKVKENSINGNGCFLKLGLRKAMSISIASIAVVLEVENNKIADIRIAMGSVAPKPIRLFKTEKYLKNNQIDNKLIEEAMRMIGDEIKPIGDIRASAEYRTHVSGVLFKRALERLI